MDVIRHHAILVTTWDSDNAEHAREKAIEFGNIVTPLVKSSANDYYTFTVCPDGSKQGWPRSDDGDHARSKFISWLRSQAYDDGSMCFAWLEVEYGDRGFGDTAIVTRSFADQTSVAGAEKANQ